MKPAAVDLNQAITALDAATSKHWRLQCENYKGVRHYSCTVWGNGKRFTVRKATIIGVLNHAIVRLNEVTGPKLRIAP